MRIEPGAHIHTSTDGHHFIADRPLPQTTVDFLVRQMADLGLCPCNVSAVVVEGEAPPRFEFATPPHPCHDRAA